MCRQQPSQAICKLLVAELKYKTGVDVHRRDEMLPKQKQRSQPSS